MFSPWMFQMLGLTLNNGNSSQNSFNTKYIMLGWWWSYKQVISVVIYRCTLSEYLSWCRNSLIASMIAVGLHGLEAPLAPECSFGELYLPEICYGHIPKNPAIVSSRLALVFDLTIWVTFDVFEISIYSRVPGPVVYCSVDLDGEFADVMGHYNISI